MISPFLSLLLWLLALASLNTQLYGSLFFALWLFLSVLFFIFLFFCPISHCFTISVSSTFLPNIFNFHFSLTSHFSIRATYLQNLNARFHLASSYSSLFWGIISKLCLFFYTHFRVTYTINTLVACWHLCFYFLAMCCFLVPYTLIKCFTDTHIFCLCHQRKIFFAFISATLSYFNKFKPVTKCQNLLFWITFLTVFIYYWPAFGHWRAAETTCFTVRCLWCWNIQMQLMSVSVLFHISSVLTWSTN